MTREEKNGRWRNADHWNEQVPVGTVVRFRPNKGEDDFEDRRTRSVAWELGDGSIVVSLEGRSGGCSVAHMELLT